MKPIRIHHVSEGNLKDISIDIKRNAMTMVTGVSGSGKSTLFIDVLFNECQRQYLEAMGLEGIDKKKVEKIENVSPAICITQKQTHYSMRSSVGTMSDIYTNLRMVYEKLARLECPYCHHQEIAINVLEEIIKEGNEDVVYALCPHCHKLYKKITRSHFSFNTKEGACVKCGGLGKVLELDEDKVFVKHLSLANGGVTFLKGKYLEYVTQKFEKAIGLEIRLIKMMDYTESQMDSFINGVGDFEGLKPILLRRLESSNMNQRYFKEVICDMCHGERLNDVSRLIEVNGIRLPELVEFSLERLYEHINGLLTLYDEETITHYLEDIKTKTNRFIKVGLGYLTLNRETSTLSGGELQRIKLASLLDTTMTGLIYILDEPTIGLHPKDTLGMIDIIQKIKELGNTIIIIEHDLDLLPYMDEIIEVGPLAGKKGGTITFQGKYQDLLNTPNYFTPHPILYKAIKNTSYIHINKASKNNLKDIDVSIPRQQITCITGISGSGKSSLIFDDLAHRIPNKENGLDVYDKIICIFQESLYRNKRSNIVTYMNLFKEIRKCFINPINTLSSTITIKDFSFNIPGGRCENCKGLGYVTHNMLFFKDTTMICPICHGTRFKPEILKMTYQEKNINDILHLTIEEAYDFFESHEQLRKKLLLLIKIGLGYIELGQTLTTLSNGEGQRLKLAKAILEEKGKHHLYLIDEPSIGLHPYDIEQFICLINELKDNGHTIVIIEHNLQIISNSDYIVDLGLEGGDKGGNLVYQGSIYDFIHHPTSYTAKYLKRYIS